MSSNKGKFQPVGVGMTPSKTEFGSFIRARRIELNIRQILLAQEIGLSQYLISMIEIGKRKYLNNDQLEQLAKALQCDIEELRKRMPTRRLTQPITELGKLIRSRREELGLSLQEFAKKMEIDPQKAKRMEVRRSTTIRYASLKPLADALELDSSTLSRFVGTTRRETKSELGQLIRTRRKELGMSIKRLAKKLNVSQQFINQIEFGKCNLSKGDETIVKIAQALELDVNKLKAVRPEKKRKQLGKLMTERVTPLGKFITTRRLELQLSQADVARSANSHTSLVSNLERGVCRPGDCTLKRISEALECEIPAELVPLRRQHRIRARNSADVLSSVLVHLSDQNLADLEKIKELSDIRTNSEVVRKALKILRLLLEKQNDKNIICLHRDNVVVELELLF